MSKVLRPLPQPTLDFVMEMILGSKIYEFLSLGGGVQSSVLWLMNIAGLITPRAEFAVFSDTMRERKGTYEYLDYLDEQSIKAGFPPIMRISEGDIISETLKGAVDIPFFTDSNNGNERGQLNRQCSNRFKIATLKREVRAVFGMAKRVQWIGFSMDEISRRNDTLYPQYITPRYPLLEMRMSRDDCKTRLKENGHPEPIKSSCTICPFRSDTEWGDMKRNDPDEFREATSFDEDSRELVPSPKKKNPQLTLFPEPEPDFHVFLHPSKTPLKLVNFKDKDDTDTHGCGSICAI